MLEFLSVLFDRGLSYSALNLARSALSSFVSLTDSLSVGAHPLVSRFMRGVFNLRPPVPRYTQVWDARVVLNYLRKLSPMKFLSLKMLTFKLCMLLALLTAERCQTLHKLRLDKMQISSHKVVFVVVDLLKTSRPGNVGKEITVRAYPPDRRLCIVRLLRCYIERTKLVRGTEQQLLISYVKPHEKIAKDTVARWIRCTMELAGINTELFKAHSTRSASVSSASIRYVPVTEIIQKAGWSSEKTFQRFYNKPVVKDSYAKCLLDSVTKR